MSRTIKFTSLLVAVLISLAAASTAHGANGKYKVTARLFGNGPAKAKATYEQKSQNGQVQWRRFKVQIERAMPLQTFVIAVNGNVVGTAKANAGGVARFQLRWPAPDSPGDGLPMPANFPKLGKTDTVAAGSLSGVFFNPANGTMQKYRLEGRTPNSDGFDAKVRYEERFKKSWGLERRFKVEIEDAQPNQSYPIRINGKLIGHAVTNSFGKVEFKLRTPKFNQPNEDWAPMPGSFPSLQPGDAVKVGSRTIILQED